MRTAPTVFFFMHVMKTGGTTFVQHVEANFPTDQIYPPPGRGDDRLLRYYQIHSICALSPEERARIRVYCGHFPFAVGALVGADVSLSILREPVERTVSFLRQCQQTRPKMGDLALEEIYEDSWLHPCYIHNYQSKLFAMTTDDKLESHLDAIDVDGARLSVAMANLEQVDVLGLNEDYPAFVDEVRGRWGWHIATVPNLRVTHDRPQISSSFRARILEENSSDVALYERASQIVDQRARRR